MTSAWKSTSLNSSCWHGPSYVCLCSLLAGALLLCRRIRQARRALLPRRCHLGRLSTHGCGCTGRVGLRGGSCTRWSQHLPVLSSHASALSFCSDALGCNLWRCGGFGVYRGQSAVQAALGCEGFEGCGLNVPVDVSHSLHSKACSFQSRDRPAICEEA